jgi:hypothetical protein
MAALAATAPSLHPLFILFFPSGLITPFDHELTGSDDIFYLGLGWYLYALQAAAYFLVSKKVHLAIAYLILVAMLTTNVVGCRMSLKKQPPETWFAD